MHVIQIIRRRAGPRLRIQVPLMPGELHPVGIDVESSGLFSKGVVDVVVGLTAGRVGGQADGAQVVEGEVAALAAAEVAGEEEAVAVDVVLGGAPNASVVQEVPEDLAAEVAERPV